MSEKREVVTSVSNAVLYSDGTIRLDNVRASYPHLEKPYAGKNDKGEPGDPKFGIVCMLDKKTHVAAKDLIVKIMEDLQKKADLKIAKDKRFIRNGDDTDKAEYVGYWTVSAREERRPSVRNSNGSTMDQTKIGDTIYAGCRVNVLIRPWVQNNTWGKRINAGLVAVQFNKDDEQIGEGRIDDEGVFESVESGGGDGLDSGDDL